jgi:hypothetical protein
MTARKKASCNVWNLRKSEMRLSWSSSSRPKCCRKFTFAMSDPALRVMKAVAEYYSLHRNLRLDFINCKPKRAVEHLVSVIRPATLKTLIESKIEMDKSELKKDFLEYVTYLE